MSILLMIIYLNFVSKINFTRGFILLNVFILTLCISHTGTFLFILFFSILSFWMYSLIMGKIYKRMFITIILIILYYKISITLFPNIHYQYLDKGRLVLSIGENSLLNIFVLPSQLTDTFYIDIIKNASIPSAILICSLIYAIGQLTRVLHDFGKRIVQRISKEYSILALNPLFILRDFSHGLSSWPIWLGPINFILAIIGLLKANKNLVCLFLTVALITVSSGSLTGERALREAHYFFVILPVLSGIGFTIIKSKTPRKNKVFSLVIFMTIFSSIIVIPTVGNIYYHPQISGENYEIESMKWLSKVGKPYEGAIGSVGARVAVYSEKIPVGVVSVSSGPELSRLGNQEYSTYFEKNSELDTKNLFASFNVKYLILNKKTFEAYNKKPLDLKIDENTQVDKIYSTKEYFSIYSQIPSIVSKINITPKIEFKEDQIEIRDAGSLNLVETEWYKVKFSKESPKIVFLGNKSHNYFGNGGMEETLLIKYLIKDSPTAAYGLNDIGYSLILLSKNIASYKTILKYNGENWATLLVNYTFYPKAIKREIIICNDWISQPMNVRFTTRLVSPLEHFMIRYNNKIEERTVYPNEDYVVLKDKKFDSMFVYGTEEGILFLYDDSSPYPSRIVYKGYTGLALGYYMIDQDLEKRLYPTECLHVTQWISIGTNNTAYENVDDYNFIEIYPYQNGIVPLLLLSYLGDINKLSEDTMASTIAIHDALKEKNIKNYIEVLKTGEELNESKIDILKKSGIKIIFSPDFYSENKSNLSIKQLNGSEKGLMIKDASYTFNAIEEFKDEIEFIISKTVPPPLYMYYREGWRLPEYIHYRGNETSLVLLPISQPIISEKEIKLPSKATFYDVMNSAIEHDGIVIFRFDSKKLKDSEALELVLDVLEYAKKKGMNFSTPLEIVNHYRLLKNISIKVFRSDNKTEILVRNDNIIPVKGITLKVKMSEGNFTIKGCNVVNRVLSDKQIFYLSLDLAPGEDRTITLFRS